MTVRRVDDWALQLDDLVSRRVREPFAWGVNDCALFAADAVLAMTGIDFAAGMRGKSAKSAMRFVRVSGGLEEIVSDVLGPMCGTSQVSDGDLVLVRTRKGAAVAVVIGTGLATAPGPNGLAAIPLCTALCGWKVG